MNLTNVIHGVNRYRHIYKNWLYLSWKARKYTIPYNRKLRVKIRNGKEIYLWGLEVALLNSYIKKGISINDAVDYVVENKIPFKGSLITIEGWLNKGNVNNGNIFDVFINEEYSFLNTQNRDVIDIGASIGDSSIYFALSGAKRVIGLEPFPHSYSFAVRNVEINNLSERIKILNAGYGQDGEVFADPNKQSLDYHQFQPSTIGQKIKIYSLESLVKNEQIKDGVLKMDCEGCEYYLVKEKDEVIRHFNQIQIEYHYGYQQLVTKIESAGFEVKWTNPLKFYDPREKIDHNMELGYVYATRI